MDGEELLRRRKALGLSQTELGQLLGLAQNTVSRWEKGTAVIGHAKMLSWALTGIERTKAWVDTLEGLAAGKQDTGDA
jgi:transcriptional regulator with XRE-family HTH domain